MFADAGKKKKKGGKKQEKKKLGWVSCGSWGCGGLSNQLKFIASDFVRDLALVGAQPLKKR